MVRPIALACVAVALCLFIAIGMPINTANRVVAGMQGVHMAG